jgi:D-tagatose-1,6-bisphosphate aldolase subunit GatZ/KbaZ
MLAHPENWQKYYGGDAHRQHLLRSHSYSDRIRYYWGYPEVQQTVVKLIDNLRRTGLPEMMLSQYCPLQYAEIRNGRLQSDPKEIVIANIQSTLRPYSEACMSQ